MSNHEPKEEIYRGVSTLDEPSAKWGWHGISKSAMQKAGWISVIFLLGMTIGNHKGNCLLYTSDAADDSTEV